MDKDWWLGRTPEQRARKAKAQAKLDNLKADKLEKEAASQEKRALKMSKKIGRGGRRGMKATIAAQGLREQAERQRKAADAIESEPRRPPDPMKPIGSSHSTELPPPQWAADPHGEHRLRWWDGAKWTDETAD